MQPKLISCLKFGKASVYTGNVYTDPRGGHNRKQINTNFFKEWSPKMAYVLGLICADGAVEDVRKSSRTCYFQITSVVKDYLEQVRDVMDSTHSIYQKTQATNIKGKKYQCRDCYSLRIGSKSMVQDLVDLGVTPRKSLRLRLPPVPDQYFPFFLRGYFDGDGCVHTSKKHPNKPQKIYVIFTSGCQDFLVRLSEKLASVANKISPVYYNQGAYRLKYGARKAVKILKYMYQSLNDSVYLNYKFHKFSQFQNSQDIDQ